MPSDSDHGHPTYDPDATYPLAASTVQRGWAAAVSDLPTGTTRLSIDGPAMADWERLRLGLTAAARESGRSVSFAIADDALLPFERIVERTSSPQLGDDPHFEMLPEVTLSELFARRPVPPENGQLRIVLGPGAALSEHDVLWYADLPKRYAERAIAEGAGVNLGQQPTDGPPSTRRLQYVDWPLLDQHRDAISGQIRRWLDVSDPAAPTHIDEVALSATLRSLAGQPFRTRSYFNSTSWGGHWAQRTLGVNPEARNTALGYELIAPESGILLGTTDCRVEIPLQLLVSLHPSAILGDRVHQRFGTSFPVRFDYLDTEDGGSLSVHTHPQPDYMKRVFGWPYTQHESYYLMSTSPESVVFLGLRGDADLDEFAKQSYRADHDGVPFDIEQHVQTFPAQRHQLYLVPAGTPHGSGKGNVVLEISATPYLYSLRFYDWLRTDASGRRRPVHVDHAFSNLNDTRRGEDVERELVQPTRQLGTGNGWTEELLGRLPEMFFEVRRIVLNGSATAPVETDDGLNVLNLVEGASARIETDEFSHDLVHAESIVIPASVGSYTVRSLDGPVRVVRCVIRDDL